MWVGGCVQVAEIELAQSCICKLVLRNGLCHRSRLRDNYLRVCVCNVGRKGGSVSVTVLLCVSVSVWGRGGGHGAVWWSKLGGNIYKFTNSKR